MHNKLKGMNPERKPYTRPELKIHGDFVKLTLGPFSPTTVDNPAGQGTNSTIACGRGWGGCS